MTRDQTRCPECGHDTHIGPCESSRILPGVSTTTALYCTCGRYPSSPYYKPEEK